MTEETSYEVQSKRGGAWTIRESFQGHQKDHALSTAKDIFEEESKVEAVKVVKAVMDPETGNFNESVTYRNVRQEVITKKTDGKGNRKTGGSSKKSRAGAKKDGKKKSLGLSGFVFRLIGGVLISLITGGVCAMAAEEFLGGKTVFGIAFIDTANTALMISVFFTAFLISMAVIAYLLIQKVQIKAAPKKVPSPAPSKNKPSVKPQASLFMVAAYLAVRPFTLIFDALSTMKRLKEVEAAAEASAPASPPPSEGKQPSPEDDALSPAAKQQKEDLRTFLNRALDGGQADKATMDNFNRFGVSLFVAGASETLTSQGKIEPKSQITILADCLSVLRFKKSHALSLAERYEEYLLADTRYMQMFQTGRAAILVFLEDNAAAPRLLNDALADWNKPKPTAQESGPVTVMFANMIRPPERPGAEGEEKAE
ncbi:MAG: hypothetical protein HN719_05905, partial [Alphaproteobacteria bacterium]|nr:hypothetical protein [Alphaproteobacteria bacterium]